MSRNSGPYRDDRRALHERLRHLQNENAALRRGHGGRRGRAISPIGVAACLAIAAGLAGTAWRGTRTPVAPTSSATTGILLDEPSPDLPLPPTNMTYAEAMAWHASHPTGRVGRRLSSGELARPLSNASGFVEACGARHDAEITARVAVKYGAALGVTVATEPADARAAACIATHIRQRSWPWSSATEQVEIRY